MERLASKPPFQSNGTGIPERPKTPEAPRVEDKAENMRVSAMTKSVLPMPSGGVGSAKPDGRAIARTVQAGLHSFTLPQSTQPAQQGEPGVFGPSPPGVFTLGDFFLSSQRKGVRKDESVQTVDIPQAREMLESDRRFVVMDVMSDSKIKMGGSETSETSTGLTPHTTSVAVTSRSGTAPRAGTASTTVTTTTTSTDPTPDQVLKTGKGKRKPRKNTKTEELVKAARDLDGKFRQGKGSHLIGQLPSGKTVVISGNRPAQSKGVASQIHRTLAIARPEPDETPLPLPSATLEGRDETGGYQGKWLTGQFCPLTEGDKILIDGKHANIDSVEATVVAAYSDTEVVTDRFVDVTGDATQLEALGGRRVKGEKEGIFRFCPAGPARIELTSALLPGFMQLRSGAVSLSNPSVRYLPVKQVTGMVFNGMQIVKVRVDKRKTYDDLKEFCVGGLKALGQDLEFYVEYSEAQLRLGDKNDHSRSHKHAMPPRSAMKDEKREKVPQLPVRASPESGASTSQTLACPSSSVLATPQAPTRPPEPARLDKHLVRNAVVLLDTKQWAQMMSTPGDPTTVLRTRKEVDSWNKVGMLPKIDEDGCQRYEFDSPCPLEADEVLAKPITPAELHKVFYGAPVLVHEQHAQFAGKTGDARFSVVAEADRFRGLPVELQPLNKPRGRGPRTLHFQAMEDSLKLVVYKLNTKALNGASRRLEAPDKHKSPLQADMLVKVGGAYARLLSEPGAPMLKLWAMETISGLLKMDGKAAPADGGTLYQLRRGTPEIGRMVEVTLDDAHKLKLPSGARLRVHGIPCQWFDFGPDAVKDKTLVEKLRKVARSFGMARAASIPPPRLLSSLIFVQGRPAAILPMLKQHRAHGVDLELAIPDPELRIFCLLPAKSMVTAAAWDFDKDAQTQSGGPSIDPQWRGVRVGDIHGGGINCELSHSVCRITADAQSYVMLDGGTALVLRTAKPVPGRIDFLVNPHNKHFPRFVGDLVVTDEPGRPGSLQLTQAPWDGIGHTLGYKLRLVEMSNLMVRDDKPGEFTLRSGA